MQIVIDIPDRIHYGIEKGITVNGSSASQIVLDAVKNGTPLPKGYGRLISADSLIKSIEEKAKRLSNADTINGLCGAVALIFDAPTVIQDRK